METTLWEGGIIAAIVLRADVFPEAVPPATKMFISYWMESQRKAAISEDMVCVFSSMKVVIVQGFLANLRMVMVFPLVDMGNSVAETRSPETRAASRMGLRRDISLPLFLPIWAAKL